MSWVSHTHTNVYHFNWIPSQIYVSIDLFSSMLCIYFIILCMNLHQFRKHSNTKYSYVHVFVIGIGRYSYWYLRVCVNIWIYIHVIMCMRISAGLHVEIWLIWIYMSYINILLNMYILTCSDMYVYTSRSSCWYVCVLCYVFYTSEYIYMWSHVCVYQLAFMLKYDLYQYVSENIYICM